MMPFQKRVKSQEQFFFLGQKLPFLSGSKLPRLTQLNCFWGECHTGQELKPKTLTTVIKTPSQFMAKITALHIKNATSNAKPKMGFVSGSPSFLSAKLTRVKEMSLLKMIKSVSTSYTRNALKIPEYVLEPNPDFLMLRKWGLYVSLVCSANLSVSCYIGSEFFGGLLEYSY
jgi:hypothetical protein